MQGQKGLENTLSVPPPPSTIKGSRDSCRKEIVHVHPPPNATSGLGLARALLITYIIASVDEGQDNVMTVWEHFHYLDT